MQQDRGPAAVELLERRPQLGGVQSSPVDDGAEEHALESQGMLELLKRYPG
jgi:hypothetical protein